MTFDLAANRLWIETSESFAVRTKEPRTFKRASSARPESFLDIFIAVQGKHGPFWFELDSGNVAPVLIAPHAFAELGQIPSPPMEAAK